MKRLIETIKNIFKIEELRKRIVYSMLLLLVYRLGSYVVLPGIDPTQLTNCRCRPQKVFAGNCFNMFSGGVLSVNASIFALGFCLISRHSIVITVLGIMVPYFSASAA